MSVDRSPMAGRQSCTSCCLVAHSLVCPFQLVTTMRLSFSRYYSPQSLPRLSSSAPQLLLLLLLLIPSLHTRAQLEHFFSVMVLAGWLAAATINGKALPRPRSGILSRVIFSDWRGTRAEYPEFGGFSGHWCREKVGWRQIARQILPFLLQSLPTPPKTTSNSGSRPKHGFGEHADVQSQLGVSPPCRIAARHLLDGRWTKLWVSDRL